MRSLKGKRVLVAGGAGFIGSHLVDRIIKEDPEIIIVVDDFSFGSENNLIDARSNFDRLNICRLDAGSLSSMRDLAQDYRIDVVFNLASSSLPMSLLYPESTIKSNIDITTTFCELARTNDIGMLVHFSSSEVYGTAKYIPMNEQHPLDPTTPYAASKAACDLIVNSYQKTFGINTLTIRPFNNYGPRQCVNTFDANYYLPIIPSIIKCVNYREPIKIYGDGGQSRDFVFVNDTVEAVLKLYNSGFRSGHVVNVATGLQTRIDELVYISLRLLGKPNHPVEYVESRPADVFRHCGDSSLLKTITGFEPQIISDELLLTALKA